DASALQAVTVRLPAGSGTLATEASVQAEQQARIDGDSVNAKSINVVQARSELYHVPLLNGGFESGLDNWVHESPAFSAYNGVRHSGMLSLRCDVDAGIASPSI